MKRPESGAWRRYADFYSGSRRWIALAILLGVAELGLVIPVPLELEKGVV